MWGLCNGLAWVKFSIQNVVFKCIYKEKLQNSTLAGVFLVFLKKCLQKFPNSTKPPQPSKIPGCTPVSPKSFIAGV